MEKLINKDQKASENFCRGAEEALRTPNPAGRRVKIYSKEMGRVIEGIEKIEKLPSGKEVLRVYHAGIYETYKLFRGEKPEYVI